jgi:hypothetical protein
VKPESENEHRHGPYQYWILEMLLLRAVRQTATTRILRTTNFINDQDSAEGYRRRVRHVRVLVVRWQRQRRTMPSLAYASAPITPSNTIISTYLTFVQYREALDCVLDFVAKDWANTAKILL